jgi:ankyrin repeat protein
MRAIVPVVILASALCLLSFRWPDGLLVGPAFVAVGQDDPDAVRALLRRGLDVNTIHGGLTPLMYAASLGRARAARVLIERGARVDSVSVSGASALHFAALTGNEETIALLVRAGADPNARDARGWTPLMYAVTSRDRAKVIALLESGASATIKNDSGEEALQIAAGPGKTEITSLLSDAPPPIPH